jgi:hypothetical protein
MGKRYSYTARAASGFNVPLPSNLRAMKSFL